MKFMSRNVEEAKKEMRIKAKVMTLIKKYASWNWTDDASGMPTLFG